MEQKVDQTESRLQPVRELYGSEQGGDLVVCWEHLPRHINYSVVLETDCPVAPQGINNELYHIYCISEKENPLKREYIPNTMSLLSVADQERYSLHCIQ